jgi:hypothetical protein
LIDSLIIPSAGTEEIVGNHGEELQRHQVYLYYYSREKPHHPPTYRQQEFKFTSIIKLSK